jgi:hypothetical protein
MQTRMIVPTVFIALLLVGTAGTATAEIILTIDKPAYTVGEVVHVTAYNAGPTVEQFVSEPPFVVWNQDTGERVIGCLGLPVLTPFPVGETVSRIGTQGSSPNVPGNYAISVVSPNGTTASYVLTDEVVESEQNSWSSLKALYR